MLKQLHSKQALLDDNDIFDLSEIEFEHGRITGMAATTKKRGGYSLNLSFTSYQYERHGETHWNHVPHVTVVDPDGVIVYEPDAAGHSDPNKALGNGVQCVEYVYNHLTEFI